MALPSPHSPNVLYPDHIEYIFDDGLFAKEIKRITRVGLDFREPFKEMARAFRQSKKGILKLKGPGVYIDLKPATKARKRREFGREYPPLVGTGDMMDSVINERHRHAYTKITKDTLTIGSRHPLIEYHDSGEPRRKIPLRKVLFWGPEAPRFAKGPFAGLPGIAKKILYGHFYRKLGFTPTQIGEFMEAK